MKKKKLKEFRQEKKHRRIRQKVVGTSEKRLRLCVHRSHKNLYAQVINDTEGKTVLSLSTQDKQIKQGCASGGNVKAAKVLGELLAGKAKEKGVGAVAFDKSAYKYHGRIKALAESARKAGLEF